MAKKKKAEEKDVERVGMTPEREAEIAKETEAALASSRKAEADRIARVGAAGVKGTERTAVKVDANPGVKFKKKITRDRKTGRAKVADIEARVVGQEDSGSAGPKVQLPGPVVSTGKKLARIGARAPKRGELARGDWQTGYLGPAPKKPKKVAPKPRVERDANTGRAKKVSPPPPPTPKLTVLEPAAPEQERSRPSLAPGAGPLREPVYIDESRPVGEKATRKLKGLAVPHKVIAPAVNQALKHLDDMAATRGTAEHHGHAEAFNAIHPTILGMDSTIHHALGAVYHHTMYPKHNSSSVITQIKSAIGDRLSEGKKMETQRAQRQGNN